MKIGRFFSLLTFHELTCCCSMWRLLESSHEWVAPWYTESASCPENFELMDCRCDHCWVCSGSFGLDIPHSIRELEESWESELACYSDDTGVDYLHLWPCFVQVFLYRLSGIVSEPLYTVTLAAILDPQCMERHTTMVWASRIVCWFWIQPNPVTQWFWLIFFVGLVGWWVELVFVPLTFFEGAPTRWKTRLLPVCRHGVWTHLGVKWSEDEQKSGCDCDVIRAP